MVYFWHKDCSYNRGRHLCVPRGLTLVEITISLLIIGLVLGIAIPTFTGVTKARLKGTAGELAASIRYIYNFSVMESVYCRMVFELDDGFYYTECCQDPLYLAAEKEEAKTFEEVKREREQKTEETESATQAEDETFAMSPEEKEVWKLQHYKPECQEVSGNLGQRKALPPNIFFYGVWVMHQKEVFQHGQALIYFFPTGFAEKSLIYLSDESEKIFTLEVKPLTGKVAVTKGYVEPPQN